MSLLRPEPVTFLRAGSKFDRGSGETTEDWSAPVVALEDMAAVEPDHGGEPDSTYRQAAPVGYRLFFDHEVAVDRLWRVRVRGEVLAVNGRPAVWRSPWSERVGTVVEVRFTDG